VGVGLDGADGIVGAPPPPAPPQELRLNAITSAQAQLPSSRLSIRFVSPLKSLKNNDFPTGLYAFRMLSI
jgi:hypothetical protein